MDYISDDPVRNAERYFAEKDEAIEKLPVCEVCGQVIQQGMAILYNDQWCCDDCDMSFWNDIKSDFMEETGYHG